MQVSQVVKNFLVEICAQRFVPPGAEEVIDLHVQPWRSYYRTNDEQQILPKFELDLAGVGVDWGIAVEQSLVDILMVQRLSEVNKLILISNGSGDLHLAHSFVDNFD